MTKFFLIKIVVVYYLTSSHFFFDEIRRQKIKIMHIQNDGKSQNQILNSLIFILVSLVFLIIVIESSVEEHRPSSTVLWNIIKKDNEVTYLNLNQTDRQQYTDCSQSFGSQSNFTQLKKSSSKSSNSTQNQNLLQIFILSRRNSFIRRQTIRNSWKKNHTFINFVIGNNCPFPDRIRKTWECDPDINKLKIILNIKLHVKESESAAQNHTVDKLLDKVKDYYFYRKFREQQKELDFRLENEHSEYNDVIFLPVIDTYRNLTQKVQTSYKYLIENYPLTEWFAKVDEDQYCRPGKLLTFLKGLERSNDYNNNTPSLLGKIRTKIKVLRQGKWAENIKDYPEKYYPSFPAGSAGHVINRKFAEFIVKNSKNLTNYQGEDVSVGIWLDRFLNQTGVTPVIRNLPRYFENNGNCFNSSYLIVGHQFSEEQLLQCAAG